MIVLAGGDGAHEVQRQIGERLDRAVPQASSGLEAAIDAQGRVRLTGQVDSWAQKHLAQLAIEEIRGVTAIDNEVVIRTQPLEDDTLERLLRALLERSVMADPKTLDLTVEEGVVTLFGAMDNLVDRRQIADLIRRSGAREVDVQHVVVASKGRGGLHEPLPRLDDSTLEQFVRDALRIDPRLLSTNVDVGVEEGVVELRGRVLTRAAVWAAEDTVANTRGVVGLENHLEVVHRKVSDPEIERAARSDLDAWHREAAAKLQITSSLGTVRLSGFVPSFALREEAEEVVQGIDGVLEVDNRLQVESPVATETRERLVNQVEERLYWSALVDSQDLRISAEGPAIVLEGEVATLREHRAVLDAARAAGAVALVDRLKVAP